jgi:hypothetical protein
MKNCDRCPYNTDKHICQKCGTINHGLQTTCQWCGKSFIYIKDDKSQYGAPNSEPTQYKATLAIWH